MTRRQSHPPSAPVATSRRRAEPQSGRLNDWFRQWHRPIGRWLARRPAIPTAEIDDLAQEVFLRLLRFGDDGPVDNPQGYLFRIASNVASEWQERSRQRWPHEHSWLEALQIDPGDEPESLVAREMLRTRVKAAVATLPARQRAALVMHVDDGLTCAQIAQRLNLTHRAVQRDLARAYSQLRLQLNFEDLGPLEPR